MGGRPIQALNDGIRTFREALENDPLASLRVDTAIVSFNSSVDLVQDFTTVDGLQAPELRAGGSTSTASAVDFAIDLVEERKHEYDEIGIPFYRPWIVLITDGASTDGSQQMDDASVRVHQAEEGKHLAFFSIGVEGADMDELNRLSQREALPLDGLNFKKLFQWLSDSMGRVSGSRTDEEVSLPPPTTWMMV
jgi:uncharacterized protein YegL